MHIHFIAIGGSVMHQLAIDRHKQGCTVTGSDDQIFDPARTNLKKHRLLPPQTGWHPDKLTNDIDAVIVGMHAKTDNPELKKAKALSLPIYSLPSYIYEHTKDKTRVVIAGSHGKTTITAMIMHVLKYWQKDFNYMVGAELEGFDTMVKLTDTAPLAILEGDEYLASPHDPRPKFLVYKPQIALISGIAWDHINVFPTFKTYKKQFKKFIQQLPDNGHLIYFKDDSTLSKMLQKVSTKVDKTGYTTHPSVQKNEGLFLKYQDQQFPIQIFGSHNLQNLSGAREVCKLLNISDMQFYQAISTFKGAAKRLELLASNRHTAIFRDFAHAPSKLKPTLQAVRSKYPKRKLIACLELHTYSSLNKKFLPQYKNTMEVANQAIVYLNPETFEHKNLPPLTKKKVKEAFGRNDLYVFFDRDKLVQHLKTIEWKEKNLLMMSSAHFDHLDFEDLTNFVLH